MKSKLTIDQYPDDIDKNEVCNDEMQLIHDETKISSGGNLFIPVTTTCLVYKGQ